MLTFSRNKTYEVNTVPILGKIQSIPSGGEAADSSMPYWGYRHLIGLLGFITVLLVNALRLSLTVALVSMVNSTATKEVDQNLSTASCSVTFNSTQISSKNSFKGDFNWSAEQQAFVIGSSFLGYSLSQAFSGRIAEIYGTKWILFLGNMAASLCTIVSPIVSWWHVYAMTAVQFIRGISQGLCTPTVFVLIANWVPRRERGHFTSLVVSGYFAGALAGGSISGFLCAQPAFGWPSVFYLFGILGIIFSISVALFHYETPKSAPKISIAELKYITQDQESDMAKKRPRIPWIKMMTSIPVYALTYGMFGYFWTDIYFTSIHPLYLSAVFDFSIRDNGLLSSLPMAFKLIGTWCGSSLSHWLHQKNYLGVDKSRKTFNFLASVSLCVFFAFTLQSATL